MRGLWTERGTHPVARPAGQTGRRRPRRFRLRAGVSLLEVTFSIGVVMIGLIGIAALIPVAGAQARRGAIADSAARTAANAVRDFHVRSMADVRTWRWFEAPSFRPVNPAELVVGNSFCIDPLYIAQGGDDARRAWFPPHLGSVQMPRITLAHMPGGLAMGPLQANQIFVAQDDLVFDLPSDDRTLGPTQNFSRESEDPPSPALRRNANGTISWMATLVPRLDRLGNPTDAYTLSIVVFSRRVLDPDPSNPSSERVVMVPPGGFYSGDPAMGGGDVRLVSDNSDNLALRGGDWVMFSGLKLRFNPVTGDPAGTINVHKWYRVVHTGEDPFQEAGVWVRDVTLIGPDWDWANMVPIPPLGHLTQVTIARGAVAVFEKTIRLETSSLWTY